MLPGNGVVLPEGYMLPSDTNGTGFVVYGEPAVANVDFPIADPPGMESRGGLLLIRSMGAYEQALAYGPSGQILEPAGYDWIGFKGFGQGSLYLKGTGSNYVDFVWDVASGNNFSILPGIILSNSSM